jgi:hypothetical protein
MFPMDMTIATDEIETVAGTYTVRYLLDEYPEQPYDYGFGFVLNGNGNCIDIATADHEDWPKGLADRVMNLLKGATLDAAQRGLIYPSEIRSGAAIARYLRLVYGLKGIVVVDRDFLPSEPSSDRDEYVAGLAWAPQDVPDMVTHDDGTVQTPESYTRNQLKQWRAWSNGDVFGYSTFAPDGTEIEDGSVWGYYGFDDNRAYVLSEVTDVAHADAMERLHAEALMINEMIDQASSVGAGIIGLI